MALPYAVRRAAEICPDVLTDNITRRLNYSSFVNFERRYLYFEVPKAACSSLKWLLHKVERLPPIRHYLGPNREARRDMFIHARENLDIPSLLQLDDAAQEYALTSDDFMRFTVVRNPYTRLESAWKDKVRLCAPRYEDLCLEIKGALPSGDDPASQVTFAEFVQAVEGQDIMRGDSHWRSQWEHTLRGSLNFTHVGRMETLSDVVEAFLAHIGETGQTIAPAVNVASRETDYDAGLARRVYDLYARDFEGFGYDRDSWPRPPKARKGPRLVPESRFVDEVLERNIVIGQLYEERDALRRRIHDLETEREAPRREIAQASVARPPVAQPPVTRPDTSQGEAPAAAFSVRAAIAAATRPAAEAAPPAETPRRRAIVTPYYQEDRATLERCLRSVRDQSIATDHILVADGFPQDWIDDAGVRHIRLDRSHGDYGDTPRGIGAMIAAQEGYDAVGFLDADCWLEPDHVEYCRDLADQAGDGACDYVIALRHERRPDGTIMQVGQVSTDRHVDTNCFFFLRSSFHLFPVWGAIPQPVSVVGDRLFYKAVKANGLKPAIATRKTVNYTCLWESIYRVMGEEPPPGAKPNPDHQAVEAWIRQRTPAELAVINRAIQTPLEQLYPLYTTAPALPPAPETPMHNDLAERAPEPPAVRARTGRPTVCLSMIVKNEAPVIARCLDSVRSLIDYWIIVDTGSTDGTQDIIREQMRDLPGELHERPWRDFAFNRSEALTLARPHADYSLIIDADDALEIPDGYETPDLTADSYMLDIQDSNIRYQRNQLVRNTLPWRYEGVLHEYLTCEGAGPSGHLSVVMRRNHDGARRRDPETYRRDAALLQRTLEAETNPFLIARYTFYLAQSYRDCGEREKAVEYYLRRGELGYWNQEVFFALYQAGKIKEELGHDDDELIALYLRASDAAAGRVEALHAACRICRIKGRNQEGYQIGKRGLGRALPQDGLFVEPWVYEYGLRDEFGVNAYWSDHFRECLDVCLELLDQPTLPGGYRDRILANARFASGRLTDPAEPGALDVIVWPTSIGAPPIVPAAPAVIPARVVSGRVSIVTPTRNRKALLENALTYVRGQDYPDVEWLVLDDSLEDNDAFKLLPDDNVTYLRLDKAASIGEKRNLLVERARGEVIVQFDDDDYYAPTYVSHMVAALAARGADLINLRGWHLYDVRSKFFGYWDLMRKLGPHYRCDRDGVSLMILDERHQRDFEHNHLGFGFSYAFRRSVWQAVKFPEVNFDEDGRFSRKAAETFKVDGIYDTTGLCLHVMHAASSSRCYPQHHLPSFQFNALFPGLERLTESTAE